MRCPSCDTQNEPDSRFCGGCGARLSGVENRLAPTQKIHADPAVLKAVAQQVGLQHGAPSIPPRHDAPQPTPAPNPSAAQRHASTPQVAQPQPSAAQPSRRPPSGQQASERPNAQQIKPPSAQQVAQRSVSAPPGAASRTPNNGQPVQRSASVPPGSRSAPQPAQVARGSTDESNEAVELPKRSRGLLVAVLLLDIGFAATGAWLLTEGLSANERAPAVEPAPGSAALPKTGAVEVRSSAVAKQTAVAPPSGSPSPSPPAGSPAPSSTPIAAPGSAAPPVEQRVPTTTQGRKLKRKPGTAANPIDPYQDPLPPEQPGPALGPTPPPAPPLSP